MLTLLKETKPGADLLTLRQIPIDRCPAGAELLQRVPSAGADKLSVEREPAK